MNNQCQYLRTCKPVDQALTEVTTSSLTGNPLAYLAKQWPMPTVYCEDGRLDIDKECRGTGDQAFDISRNNWIFSDIAKGVKASVTSTA